MEPGPSNDSQGRSGGDEYENYSRGSHVNSRGRPWTVVDTEGQAVMDVVEIGNVINKPRDEGEAPGLFGRTISR